MSAVTADRLATVLVEVADTLVDDFDLLEFLNMLVDRAGGLVDAAAVGLMLADERGRLQFMAGSDENVRSLELSQLQNRQGACIEAFHTGQPVIDVDLEAATARWSRFAPTAVAAGFRSVHAFPLRLREQVIGTLNVFGTTEGGDFQDTDVAVMQAVADVATIALLQERVIRRSEALTGQLQGALNSRIIIEQAKGIIAQQHSISVDAAFAALRAHARRNNLKLTDLALQVVTGLTGQPRLQRP